MKSLKNFGIAKKLTIMGVVTTTVVALSLTAITIWQNRIVENIAQEEVFDLSRDGQQHIVSGIIAMLNTQQKALEEKIGYDLNVAEYLLEQEGGVSYAKQTIQWLAVNQLSQQAITIDLPRMMVGNIWLGQNRDISKPSPVVDKVKELIGSTCTIFQRMNNQGDMLRVATNVQTLDNKRAIGTYIPAKNQDGTSNAVIQKIMAGERYIGRAFVVNKWYVTAYEPIFDSNKNIIGMFYVGVPEESNQNLRQEIIDTTVGKTGYVYVLDPKGTYIISEDGKRDGENIWNAKDAVGDDLFVQDIIKKALALKPGEYAEAQYDWQNPGDPHPREKTVTIGYFAPWQWIIAAGTWSEELWESIYDIQNANTKSRIIMFIFLAAALAIVVFVWIFLAKTITSPIKKTVDTIKYIGEGDFTKTLNIKSKDELGELAKDYNLAVNKIKNLILTITDKTTILSNIGIDLSSNMNQTAASINEISANIQSLKNQAINQSASVTETNSTMEQITQNIEKLDKHIARQSSSIEQSSSAIEEMLANIASVTQTLVKNAENMKELTAVSEKGHSDLTSVSDSIQNVAKESEKLLAISTVIQSIASQTNLLSMNAAIEAAHAGESGKGFSVVADEIRKLAESSGSQAKTVSTVLKKIKEDMDRITASANIVLQQFEDINVKIKSVSDQEQSMKLAMDEQGEGSKEILKAISQINEITDQVRTSSGEMLTGSKEIIRESNNLNRITEEISGNMNEMASGVEEITKAMNNVNEVSKDNKESIDALIEEVGKFKIKE